MQRQSEIERITAETNIRAQLGLDGNGLNDIQTGIPFFDHMLTLFSVHGFFDLAMSAEGDLEVDFHHTVEDVGIVLGGALNQALGDRKGICRYGHAVTPMDESLAEVIIDLSKRPYLVVHLPQLVPVRSDFDYLLLKEFLRAFSTHGGLNLHVNVPYGENEHHMIEAVFKSLGRALDQACSLDGRIKSVRSSKGKL
jgi:imidazoleglycerol-phosphate dehydratase